MFIRYATDNNSFFSVINHDFNYFNHDNIFHLFQFDQLIPCFARCYVLERMGFEDHESFETKKIILSTHHGVDFQVKLYNAQSVTHFGCKNWEALCKMYGFDEGMLVTMDLGDPTIAQERPTIFVLVDTPPILPSCELNIVIK